MVLAVVAAGVLGGCGRPDEAGTALAITDPDWSATGRFVGRCRPTVVVDLPPGTTRIEDAATGTVVDLPTR